MKVQNMTSANGNKVANQFIMTSQDTLLNEQCLPYTCEKTTFQSYDTIICEKHYGTTTLDTNALSYSKTTSKFLFQFLGETRKEIEAKIKSGEYILANLNE